MRVFQINSVCGIRSTGRIATDIYNTLKTQGHDCFVAYGREEAQNIDPADTYRIGTDSDVKVHALMSRITDRTAFFSKKATEGLIEKIKEYDPDVIQLHNLHGYYLNIEVLFRYLSSVDTPVFWTLHDCWPFTGHCAYYDYAGCEKWKTLCYDCPQKKEYPASVLLDNSRKNHERKRQLFSSVKNLNLICISDWIKDQAKNSYLKDKYMTVIHNGIDLSQFKPVDSDFRKKFNIENKKMILGVASIWDKRKGFDTFVKLAQMINDDEVIVMVGLREDQLGELPENIIGIKRTNSVKELAEIYTAADVFINPTMEEGLGLVNIEAQACGTPVITYNTGGSPECVSEKSGIVIPKGDIDALLYKIRTIDVRKEDALTKAAEFDKKKKYDEYIKLYSRCLK